MKPLIIGLTGGIGMGKSTAGKMFRKFSCGFIDADEVAHRLLQKGTSVHKKVIVLFGKRILSKAGVIDRRLLANLVFQPTPLGVKRRKALEKLLHPAIFKEIKKGVAGCDKKFFVIEAPLLFEAGWDKKVDVKVVVFCSKEKQQKRCDPFLQRRKIFQLPISEKLSRADFAIDTTRGLAHTGKQVRRLVETITDGAGI